MAFCVQIPSLEYLSKKEWVPSLTSVFLCGEGPFFSYLYVIQFQFFSLLENDKILGHMLDTYTI